MARRFDLVVFDWDGTLVDSADGIVRCLQAAIDELGWPSREARTLRETIGLSLVAACYRLFPDAPPGAGEQLLAAYRRHYFAPGASAVQPFEGVPEVLDNLARAGYRLAVATGKGRAGLDRVLSQSGLGPWFEATRCADETAPKPDPAMLHELMQVTEVPPGRTLMVGDTEFDLHMARAAGVEGIAALYGAHEPDRLRALSPLACIECIDHLPGMLARLGEPQ